MNIKSYFLGLADSLRMGKIPCFGPSKLAAQIEASKSFAKAFMEEYNIPTAKWVSFDNANDACKHIEAADYNALVIKADGLAAGKGVVVAENKEEAIRSVKMMLEVKIQAKKLGFSMILICMVNDQHHFV